MSLSEDSCRFCHPSCACSLQPFTQSWIFRRCCVNAQVIVCMWWTSKIYPAPKGVCVPAFHCCSVSKRRRPARLRAQSTWKLHNTDTWCLCEVWDRTRSEEAPGASPCCRCSETQGKCEQVCVYKCDPTHVHTHTHTHIPTHPTQSVYSFLFSASSDLPIICLIEGFTMVFSYCQDLPIWTRGFCDGRWGFTWVWGKTIDKKVNQCLLSMS